jgi:glyoxylase-like metal-dependent hydrolase (beta-lactamase superfamily II)
MLKVTRYGDVTRFDLARTLAGRGRYWTTAYLLDGLLVDTGCRHSAPELALPVLADPRRTQPLQPYRRLFWGWPEPSKGRPISDGALIETEHYSFQVIYTSGHSPDHLCLYEARQGWLFSGDLFVGGRDRALRAGYDIWHIIASLKRIAGLAAVMLFPGSARVRDNPAQALQAKISYLEELGERVLELQRQGRDVPAIVRAVCGRPMPIEFLTLGHFSRRQLVLSYLGMNDEG